MKLSAIFLLATCLQVSASGHSQNVTISMKNAPLQKVFKEINRQTGFQFFYKDNLLKQVGNVNIDVKRMAVQEALEQCFKNLPITYDIVDKTIVVKEKAEVNISPEVVVPPFITITGKITNKSGEPIEGVSIVIKGSSKGVTTDAGGRFSIDAKKGDILIFSHVEYEEKQVKVESEASLDFSLNLKDNTLDQTVVIAYGTTTKRLNTGSVSKIKGDEIRKQPVENPMLALGGRLPGLQVTQASGIAGAPVSVIIRGKSSVGAGSEPLYVIDGVPFAHSLGSVLFSSGISAQTLGGLTMASSSTSPFINLNPSDIESMEVLKDADATAIYGSRGANGVVLITTRKAKAGKTSVDASFYTGWGRPTRLPEMMNTQQYVMMRKEAFKNDNIVPTVSNATDLMVWDTTRYVDWTNILLGQKARNMDAQVRLSGGSNQTQFSLTTGYHRETPIFYGNMHDDRVNVHANMIHHSNDNKFSIALNTTYSNDNNNLNTVNLSTLLTTVPNAPYPFDDNGNLVWSDKGISFTNPLSYVKKKYTGVTENLLSNIDLSYNISKNIQVKVDGGMNIIRIDQRTTNPSSSQNPTGTLLSTADFFTQVQRNWIVEPQVKYSNQFGKGRLQVLVGSSFQEQKSEGTTINASGYTSDELLGTPGAAATKSVSSAYGKYRYNAFFGRINYTWDGKYLANISGRRDGSSRFGPGKQFGNFGAIGAAWIFSEENFMKNVSFLNFGKIRTSMGVTGNDQIGNYQYIARWSATSSGVPYQGVSGLYPANLDNPDFAWERNRKWEAGLELGFLKNRLYVSADYYLGKTDNQLIGYTLPSQVGFTSVTANRNALVENKGWELMINSTNIDAKKFSWKSALSLTIPRSKLLAYPNLETSSYATLLAVGSPVTVRKYIPYLGVDPATGIHQLKGTNTVTDRTAIKDLAQRLYGGLQNTLAYKGWSLDIFFHFVKQQSLTSILFQAPGSRANQPVDVLRRWQNPGDITDVQKFATTGAPATQYSLYANYSDARVSTASFLRLKNVSLAYEFSKKLIQKFKAEQMRLYFQGQNLLLFTHYKIGDPETLSFSDAPIRMLTIGFQVVF